MSNILKSTRFFFETEVLSFLAGGEEENLTLHFKANCDYGFDVIDQPFYCAVSATEEAAEVKLYVRSEMGAFLESPDLGIRITMDSSDIKLTANSGRLGGSPADTLMVFLRAASNLYLYIAAKEMVASLSDLDTDEEGILVALEGEELSFTQVSGKKRPDMACTTLFGGIQMMRPYQNEIMDHWMDEMLTLEEKIEQAKDGDEDLMEELAMLYLSGNDEVEPDPEQAVYWFTRLAELDSPNAQFNLGLHCAKGFGTPRSFEKAVYWLEQAADNGDEDAPALIEKLQKAVEAEKIVDTGDAQAQAELAGTYMFIGNSLNQADPREDYKIAFDYAQKSAAQDNGDGIWALALCYEHGRGVAKNVDIAIELYERGADLGHAPSQHSLACYYFRGDVLEKNNKKAFDLCMKSAQQGYGLAMADVGRCYQFGNGVMGNMKTAVEWYEKALEVIHDPELERKTAMFKMLGENDEHWGEDYPGDEEDFDEDFDDNEDFDDEDADLPVGYIAALEAFAKAEEYENELADRGVLPDAPRSGSGVMNLSPAGFPRIAQAAEEGDKKALAILAKMQAANEMD